MTTCTDPRSRWLEMGCWTAIVTLIAIASGCGRDTARLAPEPIDVPAPAGSVVPQMSRTAAGNVALNWLEPRSDKGYRFQAALRKEGRWEKPATIDDNPEIAMFSADLPGIVDLPSGEMLAYWERADGKAAGNSYATTIHLARSVDDGRHWEPRPSPYRDDTSGTHSFVSAFGLGEEFGLVWLDGQKQHYTHTPAAGGATPKDEWLGAIGLRYASLGSDGQLKTDYFLDPITCECCPTAAAVTTRGPVVVYRDRAAPPGVRPQEIVYETPTVRDIYLVRREHGRWSEPRRVHADNWVFNGCPDNGPAVDAVGDHVVVAWWTAAGGGPHVSVAFSEDAGNSFGPAVRVDRTRGEGQVTVAIVDQGRGAIVGWLEGRETWARWVGGGRLGTPVSLGPAPSHARLPRWISIDEHAVLAAWNQEIQGRREVRMARLRRDDLSRPSSSAR